jgi:hypothetical protein
MLHQDFDFGPGRERMVDMRREVEHNRLEFRLAEAHRAKGGLSELSEKLSPHKRGTVARSAAAVMAMVRYAA